VAAAANAASDLVEPHLVRHYSFRSSVFF
jgi:hypothetical protein